MTKIVRDDGFHADDWAGEVTDIPSDLAFAELATHVGTNGMIRVVFPSFSDGRGFTLGRRLRDAGFTGRLRAAGHVISDQYAMARRSGFDEVEISDDLAQRQPQEEWQFRAEWEKHNYQSRLRG